MNSKKGRKTEGTVHENDKVNEILRIHENEKYRQNKEEKLRIALYNKGCSLIVKIFLVFIKFFLIVIKSKEQYKA